MDWHKLDKTQSADILNHIATVSDPHLFSAQSSEASVQSLPFYNEYMVYRVTNYATLPSFSLDFLSNGEAFYLLDGSPAPINMVNRAGSLYLTTANVIDYVDFYLANIRGEDGDVYLIRDIETMPFLDSLSLDQQIDLKQKHSAPQATATGGESFTITGNLFYGGTLLNACIIVQNDGMMDIQPQAMMTQAPAPSSSKINFQGGQSS